MVRVVLLSGGRLINMETLSDVIERLDDLDPDGIIYSCPKNCVEKCDEEAIVIIPGRDGLPDPIPTSYNGWKYLLEVFLVEEILEEWMQVTGISEIPLNEK